MALRGRKTSADLNTMIILIVFLCFSFFDASTIDDCFQGPNFWCFNQSTETLCNFTNKTIGLCGLSNKRCQIKSGKIDDETKKKKQRKSFESFR